MISYYLALIASIIIGIGGQICLKYGSTHAASVKILYLQPYIIGGLGLYFFAALLYIYSLKQIPVSVAFPSVSISYVAVAFIAHLLWKEPFGISQILALILIASGISLLWTHG